MIFLYVPNTRKRFLTIFKVATKHRKMSQFSRKCFLENEWFSKKRFTSKQTEPKGKNVQVKTHYGKNEL